MVSTSMEHNHLTKQRNFLTIKPMNEMERPKLKLKGFNKIGNMSTHSLKPDYRNHIIELNEYIEYLESKLKNNGVLDNVVERDNLIMHSVACCLRTFELFNNRKASQKELKLIELMVDKFHEETWKE